jgi:hypothetical protein
VGAGGGEAGGGGAAGPGGGGGRLGQVGWEGAGGGCRGRARWWHDGRRQGLGSLGRRIAVSACLEVGDEGESLDFNLAVQKNQVRRGGISLK